MSMKPILFNTDMVRDILANLKTVTRRVVKPQPASKLAYVCMGHKHGTWSYPSKDAWKYWEDESFRLPDGLPDEERARLWVPPCHTGDILYVRETWQHGFGGAYLYKASAGHDLFMTTDGKLVSDIPWRPSIYMPREAARLFLRVKDVRVERLREITEDQAKAEGAREVPWAFVVDDVDGKIKSGPMQTPVKNFAGIWDSTINPKGRAVFGWDANPWVWVIEFERCEKPEEVKS